MTRQIGLRFQLLSGLIIIIFVATLSAGSVALLGMRYQLTEVQLASARSAGWTISRLLAPLLPDRSAERTTVCRVVRGLPRDAVIRRLDLLDAGAGPLCGAFGRLPGPSTALANDPAHPTPPTRNQTTATYGSGRHQVLQITTPILDGDTIIGAVRIDVSTATANERSLGLLWTLLLLSGGLIVLFVGYGLTRQVIRPIERMQRAAREVTGGDLSITLASDGPRELGLLADAFNQLTRSVADQLRRLERQQAELATSREQVIRSEKLASVGRLAAGVAHEVGNPLQSIIGLAELLRRDAALAGESSQDLVARIQGESERIHRIIRELLDFARPVDDQVEPVDLSQVVSQALSLVTPQRRLRNVTLDCSALEHARLPPVAANTQRMIQVMVNLLLNAADAVDDGGTIRVSARYGAPADAEPIQSPARPQQVVLAVENSGAPIPVELRGRLFDPFFTTKDPGAGTGLGLSVAQGIVESYGGRLMLAEHTEPTTFEVRLYAWTEAAPQEA